MMRLAVAITACVVAACSWTPPTNPPAAPKRAPRVPLRPGYLPFIDAMGLIPKPKLAIATVAPTSGRSRPWPLSELPSLQPHHDFAMARDLCSGKWAERNRFNVDMVAYGGAWCQLQAGDDRALISLAALARTAQDDIAKAARLDVLNMAARDDAMRALERLRALKLDAPADLDVLAATYLALDLHKDAHVVIEQLWRLAPDASPLERCERVLAFGTLDADTQRLAELGDVAGPCAKRAAAVECALTAGTGGPGTTRLAVVRECFNEFPNDPDAERRVWLLTAYMRWRLVRSTGDWLVLAREAEHAMGLAGAEEIAVTALENAVRASSCEEQQLRDVAAAAYRIANHNAHIGQLEARLDALRAMNLKRCSELHE
ncbi:MAG TPA: hypothetical protein VIV11_19470 [Kofleriaceae bacterium]